MQINFEKILSHANARLALADAVPRREDQLEAFKGFLKIETERLRIRHRFGLGGGEIARGRSYLVDLVLGRACQVAAAVFDPGANQELSQCALVALGGYGRRELAPGSDIDILFLHPGKPTRHLKRFVEHVLLLLWDIGFTVGHSFRSPRECLSIAKDDLHSRTAMAEARLVTGNDALFLELVQSLDANVFSNKRLAEDFYRMLSVEIDQRYEKFGRVVCLQEPNVKESAGGLRDLHAVLWVGHTRYGAKGLDRLHDLGLLTEQEYAGARRSYEFIARVRNEAHFSTGRKTDLLTLDLQPQVATQLGYVAKRGMAASEIFMRDYYRRAQELHRLSRSFLVRALQPPAPMRLLPRLKRWGARGAFEVRGGKLEPRGGKRTFHGTALDLLNAFAEAQRQGLVVGDELKLLVRDHLHLVDARFRGSREASRAFLGILGRPGRVAQALRDMHECGFLGRYLPEFARVTFLIQHDFYHRYTVDEHTLKAIEALDAIAADANGEDRSRFREILGELEDPAGLYLGMLLHDIGKGLGGEHVAKGTRIATRVCERLRVPARTAEHAVFLVRSHLVMSHLSQRRDVTEEALVAGFATTVGTVDRLDMLLLLTYADHRAVAPGIWNEWKGSLLWDLYANTRAQLTGEAGARWDVSRKEQLRDAALEHLHRDFPLSEIERHIAMLPERYLRNTAPTQMACHLTLLRALETEPIACGWRGGADCTELTVATRDAKGLFARLAGTLTGHGLDILSVDVYTREDGLVVDTFNVSEIGGHPVAAARWPRIAEKLRGAITGAHDVDAAVEAWRTKAPVRKRKRGTRTVVRFDLEASSTSTVIEVQADDEPGLAYRIARTLATLDLDITFAKIATEKSHALDVFYVTGGGRRLGDEALPAVESALLAALASGPSTTTKEGNHS